MSKPQETPRKTRRPAARRSDIVIALLEDRLDLIAETHSEPSHVVRMRELLDELKRSLNKNSPESGEEG